MATINEAAYRLGVSPVTIRRMIRQGRLPAHLEGTKHGQTWVITEGDLQRLEHPDQPLITLEPPGPYYPDQPLIMYKQALGELRDALRTDLREQQEAMETRLARLEQALQLVLERTAPPAPHRRRWWPWTRP